MTKVADFSATHTVIFDSALRDARTQLLRTADAARADRGLLLALSFAWYSFARIHKTLRVSPAMATGVSQTLWRMQDIVALLEAHHVPQKRESYTKRTPENSH